MTQALVHAFGNGLPPTGMSEVTGTSATATTPVKCAPQYTPGALGEASSSALTSQLEDYLGRPEVQDYISRMNKVGVVFRLVAGDRIRVCLHFIYSVCFILLRTKYSSKSVLVSFPH